MLDSLLASFIYYPERDWWATPEVFGLAYESVTFSAADGISLHGWFFPHPRPVASMLFCHGNAGNISHRLENVQSLVEAGFQVFLFDYRGYGRSQGKPSEQGLYLDADAAWAHLCERAGPDGVPLVIFGRSLGGAVAIQLATHADGADALIIESTFTSLGGMVRQVLGGLPGFDRLADGYTSLDKIGHVHLPLLVIHGDRDELIPVAQGQTLFEAANEPKAWYPIPSAGHNDTFVIGGAAYFEQILKFVENLPNLSL
jgi:fermentation-respiration switch protein FrsA (DUF1100 family)